MQSIKQILIFIAITAAAVCVIGVVGYFFGDSNPGFALVVNWVAMTWVAMLGEMLQFSFPLPPAYFRIRKAEINSRLYEFLGVRIFKKFISRGPFSALNQNIRLSGNGGSLSELDGNMRAAEAGHVLAFLTVIIIMGYAAIIGRWGLMAWLMVFNILFNVYPIMLQRFNRARLAAIVERKRFA